MTSEMARSCAWVTGERIEAAGHRAKMRWPGIECAEGELDIDQLSELYGVHRATVARWLAHAKDRMRVGIQQEACAALSMSPNEFQRMFVQTQDQLELSLDTLFEPY